jgi:hypothetical protein
MIGIGERSPTPDGDQPGVAHLGQDHPGPPVATCSGTPSS